MASLSAVCLDCGLGFSEQNEQVINLYGESTGICSSCAPQRTECSNCHYWKPEGEFHFTNKAKGTRRKDCKLCCAAKQKQYREENREQMAARDKRYYDDHREEIKAKSKQYRENHREQIAAHAKQYREDHREEIKAKSKQYRENHREQIAAHAKQYREDHREQYNAAARARNATEEGKLKKDTRDLVRKLYKETLGPERLQMAEQLVGCSRAQYCAYIASQFKPGMRGNHGCGEGKYNVDHIVPFKAFKGELSTHRHIVCWWGNVQPLWHKDNISKGSRYTEADKQTLIARYNAWVSSGSPPPSSN